ncbi:MAG: hypothetical protein ABII07_04065 [Patescibacteria group bacterium]|nr:hypothetical protein [Patescibacteria group bacterium]
MESQAQAETPKHFCDVPIISRTGGIASLHVAKTPEGEFQVSFDEIQNTDANPGEAVGKALHALWAQTGETWRIKS